MRCLMGMRMGGGRGRSSERETVLRVQASPYCRGRVRNWGKGRKGAERGGKKVGNVGTVMSRTRGRRTGCPPDMLDHSCLRRSHCSTQSPSGVLGLKIVLGRRASVCKGAIWYFIQTSVGHPCCIAYACTFVLSNRIRGI